MVSIPFHYTSKNLEKQPSHLIDESVERIYASFFRLGILDITRPGKEARAANVTSQANKEIAQNLVAQSTVLLKNENQALPLQPKGKILVIGNQATNPVINGGGSGTSHPTNVYPPLFALSDELGLEKPWIHTWYSHACNKEKDTCLEYVCLPTNDGGPYTPFAVENYAEHFKKLKYHRYDAIIVFAAIESAEWTDRKTLAFQKSVEEIFEYLSLAFYWESAKRIVAINAPGPFLIPFEKHIDAILFNGMPGETYGKGLMDVMFGRVNPSAKLTFTIPNKDNEQQMTKAQYPGVKDGTEVTYTEKLLTGYRWYDAHDVTPHFAFGHGLSYTQFKYSNMGIYNKPGNRRVSFQITNVGDTVGSEVVQIYVSNPESSVYFDNYVTVKQLKEFVKVKDLKPNSNSTFVSVPLPDRAFQWWNTSAEAWQTEHGTYQVMVAASSRDIRLQGSIDI